MRDDFCAFILTHGRPYKVHTYQTLRKAGYTGKIYIVIDNEDKTEAGREALGYYHEKKDDDRNVGLGPEHDWSSHCADAFGLMAIH